MAGLIYAMMASLDGYVTDARGDFDWARPDEEVHRFANEELRRHGTEIYGRRMYETMVYWEGFDRQPGGHEYEYEFGRLWRDLDKIVVSSSLESVASGRTRLVRALDPEEMRRLKAESERDVAVAGPTLAAPLIAAGLVDEIGIYCVPVVVGAGAPMFTQVEHRLDLELVEQRRFKSGTVFMRYVTRGRRR